MNPLKIVNYTATTSLGRGKNANSTRLKSMKSGLRPCDFDGAQSLETWIGSVEGIESVDFPGHLSRYDCRNNRLALLGIQQDGLLDTVKETISHIGASNLGIVMGTSTSGILQTEKAYQDYSAQPSSQSLPEWYQYRYTHNAHSLTDFVRTLTGIKGPAYTVSTACSSSAKVFASASRLIDAGICEQVLVGGVDTLCLTTLFGFNSLQLVSNKPCCPCDQERKGISIGEAAGFALVAKTKPGEKKTPGEFFIKGYGESSDAHHMSSPHPEGKGALMAMNQSLMRAGLEPDSVSYVNLHGTGTKANDLSETIAISHLFGNKTPCSSTKGWTGHTLGACGITEFVICMLAAEGTFLPGTLNLETVDNEITARVLKENTTLVESSGSINFLSNSFGFGGSNCSILLGN